jgi:hypothetical protein
MKKKSNIFWLIAIMILLSACGAKEKPTPINWNTLPDQNLNGKIVSIEGFAHLPTLTSGGGSVFVQQTASDSSKGVRVNLPFGDGNNQMKALPDQYQTTDLQFKSDKGEACVYGDYVRITGTFGYDGIGKTYWINQVTLVEKLAKP